jgi:hypothetical protein
MVSGHSVRNRDANAWCRPFERNRKIDLWGQRMNCKRSALEQQAADALRLARRLPVGAERNDLRQLAMGLLWLHHNGMDALMNQRSGATSAIRTGWRSNTSETVALAALSPCVILPK